MSLQHRYSIAPANANLIGFATNRTGATWPLGVTATTDGLAHQVSIRNDSVTNHSAKTAVLTGTDRDGRVQTETMNLPGTSATVESTKFFKTLESIVPSATIGADTMDIGWVDEFQSPTIMLNHLASEGALIQVDATGTVGFGIEVTAAERRYIEDGTAPWTLTKVTTLDAETATSYGKLEAGWTAVRLAVTSYTDGAVLAVYVSEAIP